MVTPVTFFTATFCIFVCMKGPGSLLSSILSMRCPRCRQGQLLKYGVYNLQHLGETHTHCDNCGLKYSREPGFFYGAAYVSYSLTVAWGTALVVLFALLRYFVWPGLSWFVILAAVCLGIVVLFPFSYALSRSIWIHIFVKYAPGVKD